MAVVGYRTVQAPVARSSTHTAGTPSAIAPVQSRAGKAIAIGLAHSGGPIRNATERYLVYPGKPLVSGHEIRKTAGMYVLYACHFFIVDKVQCGEINWRRETWPLSSLPRALYVEHVEIQCIENIRTAVLNHITTKPPSPNTKFCSREITKQLNKTLSPSKFTVSRTELRKP